MSVMTSGFSAFGFVIFFVGATFFGRFHTYFWSAMTAVLFLVVLSCSLGSSVFFKCLLHQVIKAGIARDWLCMVCEKLGFSCGTAEQRLSKMDSTPQGVVIFRGSRPLPDPFCHSLLK
jgi:hypothetical protein